jgi:predicted aspartyl protease
MSIVALQLSTLCKININNNQRSKNLHLLMEINNYTNKGLVDTRASMFVLTTSMVKELALVEISQNVTSPFTTTCDL